MERRFKEIANAVRLSHHKGTSDVALGQTYKKLMTLEETGTNSVLVATYAQSTTTII